MLFEITYPLTQLLSKKCGWIFWKNSAQSTITLVFFIDRNIFGKVSGIVSPNGNINGFN